MLRVPPEAPEHAVLEALRESLRLIGGLDRIVGRARTILVKPNIALPTDLDCTSPQVTWAVSRLLVEHGCEVMIGEDPAIPTSEEAAYGYYRIHRLAERAGARVVSLRKGGTARVRVPGASFFPELEVSRIALEADLVVSAACMKAVNVTHVSLSMKNMKGVLPNRWKRAFHCEGLNQGIVDLYRALRPRLAIVDALRGRDMIQKRHHPVGLLVVGQDAVAVDAVSTRLMGFDPAAVEHLRLAGEAGLGALAEEDIEIRGEELAAHAGRFPFSPPNDPFELARRTNGRLEIVQGRSCSVCLNELGQVLSLYVDYLQRSDPLSILVGPEADPAAVPPGRRIILYGNCLRKRGGQGHFVGGCPPNEALPGITDSLGAFLGSTARGTRSDPSETA